MSWASAAAKHGVWCRSLQDWRPLANTFLRCHMSSLAKMSAAHRRSARLAARQPQPLGRLAILPDEIFLAIAYHLLALDLPTCLRFRLCCKELRSTIDVARAGERRSVRAEAEARRLQWDEVPNGIISSDGLVLTRMRGQNNASDVCWAQGPLLPVAGKTSWAIEVEHSFENEGFLNVGVCDAAGRIHWGLNCAYGRLFRYHRGANGKQVIRLPPPAPPDGWPDGHRTFTMMDEAGNRINLYRKAAGTVIEVLVDHDEGVLSFRINGGPVREALTGFPKGAAGQLRPWARLIYSEDRVRFTSPYMSKH